MAAPRSYSTPTNGAWSTTMKRRRRTDRDNRMRKAAALFAVLMLAVAGCDQGPPGEEARAPTKIINPPHNQLLALSGEMQRLGVMRAIRDNGRRCQRVEATRYQEDYRQMAMWVALCNDGRYWSLFIAP